MSTPRPSRPRKVNSHPEAHLPRSSWGQPSLRSWPGQGAHAYAVWAGAGPDRYVGRDQGFTCSSRGACGVAICELGEPSHGVFVWASTTYTMGRSWEQSRRKGQ